MLFRHLFHIIILILICVPILPEGAGNSMEKTQNTPKKSGGKISYTLQAIGLLPLLALGIAMLFFTSQWFTKTMYQEVERELYDATKSATTLLNAAYPGDYHLDGLCFSSIELYTRTMRSVINEILPSLCSNFTVTPVASGSNDKSLPNIMLLLFLCITWIAFYFLSIA